MDKQEVDWMGRPVWITGIVSKSGKLHTYVKRYVGRIGCVEGTAKNGMVLVRMGSIRRAIPAGCLTLHGKVSIAGAASGWRKSFRQEVAQPRSM